MSFIPVNEPLLNGNEKKYLNECIDTGWISSEGPFVRRFEEGMANYVGRKYAVAVTNGTAALEMAVKALGIGEGDEVIMPSFTIISCVQAVVKAGAKPVLVDSEYDSFNMKVEGIEAKITPNTKAIMVVHIYGLPVDMNPVLELAKKYNLKIIEDAAQMHGQTYNGKMCGSFGDISIFSFYPNKHITTGEGGMVLMNDERLYEKCKSLRNLCFSPDVNKRFIHEELGWNLRMTNIQAALGVAQLERINEFVTKKRFIGNMYQELLSDIKTINLPLKNKTFAENIYWVFAITLKDDYSKTAKEVIQELGNKGIGTRPFFYPMHQQPVFNNLGLFKNEEYPNATKLYERGFYIPSGLAITEEQIKQVSKILHEVLV
ncbi:DegT/DnrJ/EryC1/StrS family aminotransferase [Aliarcobacter cryaerophilus]|uniref:GDP-perosamine synthase n=2 Tax=unclassified Arcobacter TaxID=2593671 RepID=A0AA96D285_9BACT|nr:DegT/DnrJ/EryC1/StrS family aminotransferase [Arcobacter sp. AZ-2023]WPD09106.1 DegT/DnrJ/EryC1/StrS family aminotransferase [Arcobacter sp. DSM 115954]WNL13937.1 DegT/DnrJ/EryC1/StrS family aminotransferase [Arcobacter sp. AZ-2023]WNL20182.1 DegT/DnrJ/EryC1/StrS family aminotransferase [Arcobacter sp. AZ-2023]WNL22324.1 DegT/DnrJ/EryC1/StrS family aminotransferase [Arcobacter sp. AZ-2023]